MNLQCYIHYPASIILHYSPLKTTWYGLLSVLSTSRKTLSNNLSKVVVLSCTNIGY